MRLTQRLACAAVFAIALGLAALSNVLGANLSLFTGPAGTNPTADFPIGLGTVNQLIQSINSGVGGLINAQTGSVGTGADTTEDVLQTYTLPANTLAATGQSLRITCGWTTGANTNTKLVKLYFGASVVATPAQAANAQTGRLSLIVTRTAAATQKVFGNGMAGTASITPVAEYYNAGTDNLAAGVVIKCTGTNGTAAANDIIANEMLVELIK